VVSTPLLEATQLQRRYGQRQVLAIDSLQLCAGEVLAVLGPNGAGKSTLFRLLLLLENPDGGDIRLEGRRVRPGDVAARRRMAGLFQRPYLFTGSVRDNVEFGLKALGVSAAERQTRVTTALRDLGIEALSERGVVGLSGGEAQRVALARTVVLEPDVLLLDEPTANLDVTLQRRFREELGRVARTHSRGVILITHDPTDAFTLADRIAVLQDGRITQVAEPHTLVVQPATPFVAAFTGAELLLDAVVLEQTEGLARVQLPSGAPLWVAAGQTFAPSEHVQVSYRPEDIVLSSLEARYESSARNVFRMKVESLSPAGGLIRVGLMGAARLAAIITRTSAETLHLGPGVEVNAHLKAAALHAFAASKP
jgi:molybdopterin-binding protein